MVAGRDAAAGAASITVRGNRAGRPVSFEVPVSLPEVAADQPAVATVWARRRIAELSRKLVRAGDQAVVDDIVALALEHRLMTRYTAFVAVDTASVTRGGEAKAVRVPVEVPAAARRVSAGGGGSGAVGAAAVGYGAIGFRRSPRRRREPRWLAYVRRQPAAQRAVVT